MYILEKSSRTWLRMVKARHRRNAFLSISESHVMERTVVGHGIDLPRSGDFFTFLRTERALDIGVAMYSYVLLDGHLPMPLGGEVTSFSHQVIVIRLSTHT